jgi:hypothetical protein
MLGQDPGGSRTSDEGREKTEISRAMEPSQSFELRRMAARPSRFLERNARPTLGVVRRSSAATQESHVCR